MPCGSSFAILSALLERSEIEREIREDVLGRMMRIDTGDDTTRQGRRALERAR
jgi:hypothetical protein